MLDHSSRPDGILLESYLASRDDAAFAELVRRHAAMVFGVCRRVLRCRHDAEDAFQATFLVLARRAADVQPPEHVGRWLYGVAWRTARRARLQGARRATSPLREMPAPPARPTDDVRDVLDEELARLPEAYLAPVVLCDLEGRTYRDAARQLGVPVATLSNRLAAGRRVLARRLLQRGVECPTAGMLPVIASSWNEAVPASLVEAVSNASALAGARSPLADGVIMTMLTSNLGKAVAALAALFAVALGGILLLAAGAEDKNLKALAGDWAVVKAERSGKQASDDDRKAMKVTIKGATLTIESGSRKEAATIRLNPSTTPKGIDLTPAGGKETELGIYERDGDQLMLCWDGARRGERQQEFKTTEEGGGRLLVLKRLNAKKP